MTESTLLKEAIADAQAVRDIALENARVAIEEAFTPKIQSMLASKIAKEIEEDFDEEEDEDFEDEEEDFDADVDVDADADLEEGDDEDEEEDVEDEIEDVEDELADVSDELEDLGDDEEEEEEEEEEEDDLDLEAVIRELEDTLEEDDDFEDDEEFDVEDDLEDEDEEETYEEDVDEIDIDELLKELEEMDEDEELEEDDDSDEVAYLKQELADRDDELEEYKDAVRLMRDKLQEVNLLNSKLLFTNKLFRTHELDQKQKVRVIESIDRAGDVREVKLIYATLAESFQYGGGVRRKKRDITESIDSGSSKKVRSTKPDKEVLEEGKTFVSRFQQLAGIKVEEQES